MFLSITSFQEASVSQHELGWERQERGSDRGSTSKPLGQKGRSESGATTQPYSVTSRWLLNHCRVLESPQGRPGQTLSGGAQC